MYLLLLYVAVVSSQELVWAFALILKAVVPCVEVGVCQFIVYNGQLLDLIL